MEVPKREFSLLFLCILFFTHFQVEARRADLNLEVIPLIPSTITNVQLAHYDIQGSGTGPTLFKIVLNNSGNTTEENLAIVYSISVNSIILSGGNQRLYKGLSSSFSLNGGEMLSILSNSFLQESGPGVHQETTLEEMENTVLENQIIDAGKIPNGKLTLEFALVRKTGPGSLQYETLSTIEPIEVEILNVSQLDLASPGTSAYEDGTILEITTPLPRFVWFSDLLTNMYDNCALCLEKDMYEIAVYEKRAGQSVQDALSHAPIMTGRTKEPHFYYPISGKQLQKGKTYLWQVKAFLKGVKNSYLLSDTYVFRYAAIRDPEIEQIRQAILIILGNSLSADEFLELSYEFNHKIEVLVDGKVLTIKELQKLVQEFTQGNKSVISTEIE